MHSGPGVLQSELKWSLNENQVQCGKKSCMMRDLLSKNGLNQVQVW